MVGLNFPKIRKREDRISTMRIAAGALVLGVALFAILANGLTAAAQQYPSRTITLVVPFPPGGGNDATARMIAERLGVIFGQTVIVDNRGGAGGLVGTRSVAKAAPDGYTILLGHTGSIGINPTLYAHAGFDPRKDFVPLGLIAQMPLALLVHPSVPASDVRELIQLARQEPNKVTLGSSSKGTGSHMAAEMFMHVAEVKMNLIPYKGTAQVLNDLVGGHVQATFNVVPQALGMIRSGQLRALAVTSQRRSPLLREVPTAHESGLPNFNVVLNYGLLAPAGTPKGIVDKLNTAMRVAIEDANFKDRVSADGGEAASSSPEEYGAIIDHDETMWSALIRKLDLKIE
jgi:tripartite-type tricarboxylate transporter receptor subunit TctC